MGGQDELYLFLFSSQEGKCYPSLDDFLPPPSKKSAKVRGIILIDRCIVLKVSRITHTHTHTIVLEKCVDMNSSIFPF